MYEFVDFVTTENLNSKLCKIVNFIMVSFVACRPGLHVVMQKFHSSDGSTAHVTNMMQSIFMAIQHYTILLGN